MRRGEGGGREIKDLQELECTWGGGGNRNGRKAED